MRVNCRICRLCGRCRLISRKGPHICTATHLVGVNLMLQWRATERAAMDLPLICNNWMHRVSVSTCAGTAQLHVTLLARGDGQWGYARPCAGAWRRWPVVGSQRRAADSYRCT